MCYCNHNIRTPYCDNCKYVMYEDIRYIQEKLGIPFNSTSIELRNYIDQLCDEIYSLQNMILNTVKETLTRNEYEELLKKLQMLNKLN